MYDTVISNYWDLGPDFDGRCETKDLYGTGDYFWISPNGQVYHYDLDDTIQYEQQDDLSWVKLPTGKHIKLRPKVFSSTVTIFPYDWAGSSNQKPQALLNIVDGKVTSFIVYRRGDRLCQA